MKSGDSLFSLIGSLSRREKAYFKLNAERNSGKNESHLLRLFRILETRREYDEAEIKRSLKGDPLGRQYAVYKNLLFHAILRSLQAFRYERSPSMQLRSGLDKVEILVEKGKHELALKMVLRSRRIAENFAQTSYLRELLDWERRLLRYLDPLGYLSNLPRIEAYERRLNLILQQEAEANAIYDRLFAWAQVERRMEKSGFGEQFALVGERLNELAENAYPDFGIATALANARALYRQLCGDYQGMMESYRELLRLWDQNPQIRAAYPQRYARLQVVWLNSTLAAGQVGEHLPAIRALRRMPIEKMADRARLIFQSYNLELLWLMDQKDVEAALKFLPAFEEKLPELLPYLDELRLSSFYLNAAILWFQQRDYSRARTWANRLHSLDSTHQDTLFFRNALLISLICQCETGDFHSAESQLRSMKRRFRMRESDWEFGQLITDRIGRMLTKWGLPGFEELKKELLEELEQIEKRMQPVPFMLDLVRNWALGWGTGQEDSRR